MPAKAETAFRRVLTLVSTFPHTWISLQSPSSFHGEACPVRTKDPFSEGGGSRQIHTPILTPGLHRDPRQLPLLSGTRCPTI